MSNQEFSKWLKLESALSKASIIVGGYAQVMKSEDLAEAYELVKEAKAEVSGWLEPEYKKIRDAFADLEGA